MSIIFGCSQPSPISTYHGGRVAETEWGPPRGSATQNWLGECSRKTKKLQITEPHNLTPIQHEEKLEIQDVTGAGGVHT